MRSFIAMTLVFVSHFLWAQDTNPTLIDLLNHVVGGKWVSTNMNNDGEPESYGSYMMSFENWSDDKESVIGTIYGIKNNGDTTQLIEVWNFIDKSTNSLFYVQKTTWGWYSTGSITRFEEKHLDIQFKTITEEGQSFYTRDLHYIQGEDKMKAVTFHRSEDQEEWKEAGTSIWSRIN